MAGYRDFKVVICNWWSSGVDGSVYNAGEGGQITLMFRS